MLDVSRKNRVRSNECVGEYDNSVYDWEVQEILRTDSDGVVENILNLDVPSLDVEDIVDVFFTLMESDNEELARFSGPRELVLAVGEEEIQLSITDNQVNFSDLSHLALLDTADYITISLYQNNDSYNVLWEFAMGLIYVEKIDPEYPDIPLPWKYYYPSLGEKTIIVRGVNSEETEGRIVKAEILYAKDKSKASITAKASQAAFALFEKDVNNDDYMAKFKLSATSLEPSAPYNETTDYIEVKFTLLSEDGTKEEASVREKLYVKNNSNTSLAEVLEGKAVFVYDNDKRNFNKDNHKGVSADVDKFDKVQELLNQVIPRKRSVTTDDYNYIDTDGIYYNGTEKALKLFKQHFKVENAQPNTKNSFNKLMKDYGYQADPTSWVNKIIDKETLVGNQHRSTDVAVNKETNSNDTGLYELYDNVVRVFVDNMIAEAERYINAPTQDWVARTGEGSMGDTSHGLGMSYCYGCKDSIAEFNSQVVNCQAETKAQIITREQNSQQPNPTVSAYRGNVGTQNNQTCQVGGVNQSLGQWAGLTRTEYFQQSTTLAFDEIYWAGIDCSGLVQRAVAAAKDVTNSEKVTIPSPNGWITSQHYFPPQDTTNSRVFYKQHPTGKDKLLRGDLVQYPGHITMVYSERVNDDGSYQIIHAYGTRLSDHDNDEFTPPEFTRKVVVTSNMVSSSRNNALLLEPIVRGYGRIRFWD